MGTSFYFWIAGIAVAATGLYCYLKKSSQGKAKEAFLKNKTKFEYLLQQLAKGNFKTDEWADQIVDVNSSVLLSWWKSLAKRSGGDVQRMKQGLLSDLRNWGIQLVLVKPEQSGEKTSTRVEDNSRTKLVSPPFIPTRPASDVFIENLQRFRPLLKGLDKKEIDKSAWSDLIVDINNQELVEIWKKVINNMDAWLRVLASWGLTYDSCAEFVYVKGREELYDCENGEPFVSGNKYVVINPCWILTKHDGEKKVIEKGLAKLKDNGIS